MFSFLNKIFSTTNYKELLHKGAIIVDVRTGQEFDLGHIAKAKNIPLDRLETRLNDLKINHTAVICCCQSGIRSAKATKILKNYGIEAYNGGAWQSLAKKIL